MIDPVMIRSELEFSKVELLLKDAFVGEIDSYLYCIKVIVWDRYFLDVNAGKVYIPHLYRMNHSFRKLANSSSSSDDDCRTSSISSINVKPYKISNNIIWKTTRRVQSGKRRNALRLLRAGQNLCAFPGTYVKKYKFVAGRA
jgi:hypothetical protein